EPPQITLTEPASGIFHGQATITIRGVVTDVGDPAPTLTRAGTAIPVTAAGFVDADVALEPGENRITYEARDHLGHTRQAHLTVHYRAAGPTLNLAVPEQVVAGGTFTVALTVDPVETVTEVQLFVDRERVYRGEDGAPFAG